MNRSRTRLYLVVVICIFQIGCGGVGLRPIDDDTWFRQNQRSALTHSSPSDYAEQFLRQRDLLDKQRSDPVDVICTIGSELRESPSRPTASVLAELCYLQAKRIRRKPDRSHELYTTALLYAYAYLFDDELGPPPNIYDPRFRLACDLYNRSLAKLVNLRSRLSHDWETPLRVNSLLGPVEFRISDWQLPGQRVDYDIFYVAYEYQVTGLRNRYRTDGLGVPLIAVRRPAASDDNVSEIPSSPPKVAQIAAATLFVTFEHSVLAELETDHPRRATVAVLDPTTIDHVRLDDRNVTLETDLTTPLAYMIMSRPPTRGLTGLFQGQKWEQRMGLYMLHPYQPDRIPVVLVHGLMSEPGTWLVMINDLLGDPVLRERYQFWAFLYPTGNPIPYSAHLLRQALIDAQASFDPEHDDAAFNQIVLVGHSMGGVLSRLMISTSGDYLYSAVTKRPLNELGLPEEDRKLLEDVFFFKPLPFIRRVVFIATPHRGSDLADIGLARLAAKSIELPRRVTRVGNELIQALTRTGQAGRIIRRVNTSIDGLSPGSALSRAMEQMTLKPSVPYHSIIANSKEADTPGGSDKVVPYESAHLDGAVSELIVKDVHTCTDNPRVVWEVRRILLLHADEFAKPN